MNSLPLVRSPLASTHSVAFDLHPLLQQCSWGMEKGLGIVTCNTEDLVVIGLVCVFLEVFLTALYFRVTYCPHLQSLCFIHVSVFCFWVPFGGTGENKALAWVGYRLLRWGGAILFHVQCITSSFLTFFQFGENIQWITEGFALGRMCSRCVDIDHSCIKSPWVYHNSDLHLLPISTKVLWCSTVLKQYRLLMFDGSCCQMFSGYKQNISIVLHTCMQLAWRRPLEQC